MKLGVIIVSILVVLLTVLVGMYHTQIADLRSLELKNLNEIDWKTGDVIFMRCDYTTLIEPTHYLAFNLGNYLLSGGLETHVAVVVRINNIPYVYQVEYKPTYDISTRSYRWKAPMIMNLQDYIMAYVGEIQYLPIAQELDLDQTKSFIEQNHQIEFTINQLRWANTMLKLPSEPHPSYKFCAQLITDYLEHMNVIVPPYPSHHMSPVDLKAALLESGWYGNPILLNNAYANLKINGSKQTRIPLFHK